jgi:hypothetical protein
MFRFVFNLQQYDFSTLYCLAGYSFNVFVVDVIYLYLECVCFKANCILDYT